MAALAAGWAVAAGAAAETPSLQELTRTVKAQAAEIDAQAKLLADQQQQLQDERALISQQQRAIDALARDRRDDLATIEAKGVGEVIAVNRDVEPASQADATTPSAALVPPASGPAQPVGEAPPPEKSAVALVLPQEVNVLTPPGHFVFDNSLTYTQDSNNRLVFRGVEIVPGIQVGLIEANDTSDSTSVATSILRLGLVKRLEVELLVPYVYRSDRVTLLEQANTSLAQTTRIEGSGIGDVEGTLRYQLNNGGGGWPVLVGNFRVKSDTGGGPFDIPFDQFGVARRLNTGSGFWAVEPSVSALYTSDPVVLFASLGYIHSFGRDIDKMVGDVPVGQVTPGDTIEASGGFAFSVNPRFSFSLGYRHDYLFPTASVLGGVKANSTSLVVGSLLLGAAYRLTPHLSVAASFQFGVTSDAPNDELIIRLPYIF